MRKILIVTERRADYSRFKPIIDEIKKDPELDYYLVATGIHLLKEYGRSVDLIKKEGGRISQKDLRKQIPLSEAKISLMIAELESKGVIDKIKKGRGNIIILKK